MVYVQAQAAIVSKLPDSLEDLALWVKGGLQPVDGKAEGSDGAHTCSIKAYSVTSAIDAICLVEAEESRLGSFLARGYSIPFPVKIGELEEEGKERVKKKLANHLSSIRVHAAEAIHLPNLPPSDQQGLLPLAKLPNPTSDVNLAFIVMECKDQEAKLRVANYFRSKEKRFLRRLGPPKEGLVEPGQDTEGGTACGVSGAIDCHAVVPLLGRSRVVVLVSYQWDMDLWHLIQKHIQQWRGSILWTRTFNTTHNNDLCDDLTYVLQTRMLNQPMKLLLLYECLRTTTWGQVKEHLPLSVQKKVDAGRELAQQPVRLTGRQAIHMVQRIWREKAETKSLENAFRWAYQSKLLQPARQPAGNAKPSEIFDISMELRPSLQHWTEGLPWIETIRKLEETKKEAEKSQDSSRMETFLGAEAAWKRALQAVQASDPERAKAGLTDAQNLLGMKPRKAGRSTKGKPKAVDEDKRAEAEAASKADALEYAKKSPPTQGYFARICAEFVRANELTIPRGA